MKKILICSLAVLLISGCTKTPEEKIEDLFQDGTEQISNLKFYEADSTFAQIFEIDPGSITGMVGVSKLNEARLQYFDAINNYSMILSINTDYEDAFVGLYNSYKNLGFYIDALEAAVYYNKLWNKNTQTKYILGEAYKNIGELKRAETYFKQAIMSEYEHKYAAQFMLATTKALQGLKEDAHKEASQALTGKSDDPLFYNAAAEYYETIGQIDSAMMYNRKLFESNKTNINNVYIAFKRALKNNYLTDARVIIKSFETLEPDQLLLVGLRLFYALHIDDKSQIRTLGQNYRSKAPKSFTGTMYELYSRGEISDKITIAQDLQILQVDISKGKLQEDFGSFYYYAMLMLSVKYEKNPGTIPQLEAVPGWRKNRKELKLEIALNKHIVGLFEQCYADLEKIEMGHQRDADWLTGIAESWGHYAVRKYDKAEETYKKALTVNQYYEPAFKSYANFLLRINKQKEALELFKKYPQFEKNNFIALTKTKYLFINKKYQEGLKQFEQFFPSASGNIILVKELIEILKADNRTEEITALLEIMNKYNADNPDANLLLAVNAQDNNEFEKSLNYLDKVIAIEPNNPDANILKARGMYYTGNKTEAYDLFEKNLTTFNRNPVNLKYYSQILAAEGIDFPKAANMGRQAAFEGYGTYEYIINLADIYYKMGRYDLCRGESKKQDMLKRKTRIHIFDSEWQMPRVPTQKDGRMRQKKILQKL